MINTDLMTKNKVMKNIIDMLFDLDVESLINVQSFIKENRKVNAQNKTDISDIYKPLTETELIERIDKAIAQADAGMLIDSETMEKELIEEFGL